MTIRSYKQISTKKGDKGTSSDYSNNQYSKDDILFTVLGNVDELTSLLGVTYHYSDFKEIIKDVQKKLQDINSLIATTDEFVRKNLYQIDIKDIKALESYEEELMKTTLIKPVFVLPGSDATKESAYLDLSRSVARRCERSLVTFVRVNQRDDLHDSLKFMNRLSDLLFIMARNKSD